MMLAGLTSRCSRAMLVCVVERTGNRDEDWENLFARQAVGVSLIEKTGKIRAVDEVRRYPELTVVFAAATDPGDAGCHNLAATSASRPNRSSVPGFGGPVLAQHLSASRPGRRGC